MYPGKTIYHKGKWLSIVVAGVGIGVLAFFTIRGFKKKQENLGFLFSQQLNGKITKIENIKRGDLRIWLHNADTSYIIPAFAKYLDTLKVNDSLFKRENSFLIFYYKYNPGNDYYLYDTFRVYSKIY